MWLLNTDQATRVANDLRSSSRALTLAPQRVMTASSKQYGYAHHDQHQLVVPSVACPKVDVPDKHLLLNRSQHNQDEADCRELREHAEGNAKAAENFRSSQEEGEASVHSDAPAAFIWILHMIPATGEEDQTHHEPEQ